jgi:hypothetical protein
MHVLQGGQLVLPQRPVTNHAARPSHPTPTPAATCILFGDGCGAVLVSAAAEGQPCSLLGMSMHSDGNGQKSLNALYGGAGGKHAGEDGSASGRAAYCNISMAGSEVFKFAVRSVPQVRPAPAEASRAPACPAPAVRRCPLAHVQLLARPPGLMPRTPGPASTSWAPALPCR